MNTPSKATENDLTEIAKKIDGMFRSYGDPFVQAVMNIVQAYRTRRQYNQNIEEAINQMSKQGPIVMPRGVVIPSGKKGH